MKADVNRIGAPSKRNSRWKPTLVAPRGPRTDRRVAERKVPRENSGNSTESSGTKTSELSPALVSASSKGQAKRELHDARVASKGGDLARRTAAEIVAGLAELHRIGQIEYLPAEWHARPPVSRAPRGECVPK